jgi:hypothetical protein
MSDQPPPKVRVGFLFTALTVALVLFFAWSMLPMLTGGGPTKTMRIVNNLRQIETVKQMWASDHGLTGAVQISEQDLASYFPGYSSNGLVRPVIGERYIIHRLGVGPEAQITRTYGRLPAGTVIRLRPESNRLYRVFLPNQQGGADGRQPIRSESNRISEAAASRRSP